MRLRRRPCRVLGYWRKSGRKAVRDRKQEVT